MGVNLPSGPGDVAATVIPSVGCPVGCNFCSTSAMFGGKGRSIDFYRTGDELFEVMSGLERDLRARSFFMMDENFLLHRTRALRLLELMRAHGKAWSLYVFSSANVVRSYTMEQIVGLGVAWMWMGLEGQDSKYGKLQGADTRALVRELQSNGICVLGSSIIGMEEHTPDNIDAAIDYAVAHETDFHQFMLYTPIAGTPLWEETRAKGLLTDPECREAADTHGQLRFNYRHAHIPPGAETDYLLRSFQRDFDVNGPSVVRMARTILAGWRRHRHHADPRVRARIRFQSRGLATGFAGALWAARKWFRRNAALAARLDAQLHEIYRECGIRARLVAPLIGPFLHRRLRREAERLAAGWSYEPPTFCVEARQPGALARIRSVMVAKAAWLPPLPDLAAWQGTGAATPDPSS
jgi:biotin synthase-like enzyme